ncbi:glycoside hydrolase [Cristinia sonorae]|uniref:glucan 1,3-beta-glucosidase n=1 Tax=Cristinia sonorae TaxID=1940300 RepID=A0A8K0XUQ5_9AGAR|nr:glycoside hydrolase [Cristinia sonorae]
MSGPSYEPVHWSPDHQEDTPYNPPRSPISPDPRQTSFPPETAPLAHEDLPAGAARPRFIGAALAREGPNPRESYASSSHSYPINDDYNSSVYALNDARPGSTQPNFYGANYRDDPDGYASTANLGKSPGLTESPYLAEKRQTYAAPRTQSRKRMIIIVSVVVALLLLIGVGLGVYFGLVKPKQGAKDTSGAASDHGNDDKPDKNATTPATRAVVTGGDGSKVTMDDGTTFTYTNKFGGYWYWDESDPFNNGARAQSWTPALNETFKYGDDVIRGVNLGGWLNTEPVSTTTSVPALYEKYADGPNPAVDEWTLSEAMAADTAGGGLNQLEDHYKTFITELDFAEIAAAGLNFVRIPIGWWAIETRDDEPFLAKTSWTYFLKAIKWARKYGLRINLDLHALPGSQNGWNHSGRLGTVGFLNGPMGYANAQRSLDYIRILAEFISQPQYKDVVVMFGITNEPQGPTFGQENLARYYLEAYNIIRNAGGVGEGNGPAISFHEGFQGLGKWVGMFVGSDRTGLDTHPYLCFGGQSADPYSARINTPCQNWAAGQNNSMSQFGLTVAGEWSLAINDCGLFVNGVGLGVRYEGTYVGGGGPRVGSCDPWTNFATWSPAMKNDIQQFALSSMDALQNWFFWTWKIGNSSVTGKVESPQWSYQLGLQQGYMPTDPRKAIGSCDPVAPFDGPLSAWQTGGPGANTMQAAFTDAYTWPPTSISAAGAVETLPSYTPTGTIVTLPGPTFTQSASSSIDVGSGWANAQDKSGMYVPIPTCSYLDPWVNPTAAPPSPLCAGSPNRRAFAPPSRITSAPKS